MEVKGTIRRVGHVVLKVRDLDKARDFYCDVLGMTLAKFDPQRGMFLRFNDYHHDIAIFKTGPDADLPKQNQVGLVHVALVVESLAGLFIRATTGVNRFALPPSWGGATAGVG